MRQASSHDMQSDITPEPLFPTRMLGRLGVTFLNAPSMCLPPWIKWNGKLPFISAFGVGTKPGLHTQYMGLVHQYAVHGQMIETPQSCYIGRYLNLQILSLPGVSQGCVVLPAWPWKAPNFNSFVRLIP